MQIFHQLIRIEIFHFLFDLMQKITAVSISNLQQIFFQTFEKVLFPTLKTKTRRSKRNEIDRRTDVANGRRIRFDRRRRKLRFVVRSARRHDRLENVFIGFGQKSERTNERSGRTLETFSLINSVVRLKRFSTIGFDHIGKNFRFVKFLQQTNRLMSEATSRVE